MANENMLKSIKQQKLNCLAAKRLHIMKRAVLNRWSQFVDFLGLGVPLIYFPIRYITKDSTPESWAQISWEFLAGVLSVLALLKMAYRWQEKIQKHSELLGENISLVGQADRLITSPSVSQESANFFLLMAEKSEKADWDALGPPSEKDRQFAYREALKELEPGDVSVVCPICNSSPFKFTSGSCQVCGNTPAK
jgi:mobilome CxxCx(11)CxxC protein